MDFNNSAFARKNLPRAVAALRGARRVFALCGAGMGVASGLKTFRSDGGYWRDLGTPRDFIEGSADLVRGIAPSGAVPGPVGEALVLPDAMIAITTQSRE